MRSKILGVFRAYYRNTNIGPSMDKYFHLLEDWCFHPDPYGDWPAF